jgi:hypothetical protein
MAFPLDSEFHKPLPLFGLGTHHFVVKYGLHFPLELTIYSDWLDLKTLSLIERFYS